MKFIIFLLGFIIAFIGNSSVRHFRRTQRRDYEVVEATVVELIKEEGKSSGKNGGKTVEIPVLEYEYQGVTRRGKHSVSIARFGKNTMLNAGGSFTVGQKVPLRVYKDDPTDAVIDDEKVIRTPLRVGSTMMSIGIALIWICVVWVFGKDILALFQ